MPKKKPAEILKPLIDYYKKDKVRLLELCLKEGISREKIAEVLEVDIYALHKYINMNCKDNL
jgi:hypothetical protein